MNFKINIKTLFNIVCVLFLLLCTVPPIKVKIGATISFFVHPAILLVLE
ncbi:hypothetical protein AAJ76_69000530 [Vairimorpha ceranae]|uniref:Uncharacterized protein n=1 Tax=Vairimorpha ceranae TaxID=40302 RepID=A0A0F9WC90_9MICR|nr:hypothetical protein AAJ76_69000530 [Vairimorpha ceranae]KKO74455.1 hypothetical protein AAJ76_69000530 [Vairimorpha ceranae]